MRKRPGVVVLFVLIALAGFGSTLALGSARGGILPTLSVPSLPVSLPVTTAPLPPVPPAPPPPPLLPPAPPPPALPPVPPLPPAPPVLHGGTPPPPPAPGAPGLSGSSVSADPAPVSAAEPSSGRAAAAPRASRARFHTRGPGRRGTTITFHLAAPATVILLVRGPSPSCDLAGRKVVRLGKGVSRVNFLGRFHGRPLAPGTYGITMVARRGGTSTTLGRLAIAVVPPGQRIRRSSARPVFAGCQANASMGAASGSPSEPFAGLGLILQTAKNVAGTTERPKASFRPPKLSVPVPKVPALPGSSGGPVWLAVLFYAVVMLAGAGLLLLVLGFATERWNP